MKSPHLQYDAFTAVGKLIIEQNDWRIWGFCNDIIEGGVCGNPVNYHWEINDVLTAIVCFSLQIMTLHRTTV